MCGGAGLKGSDLPVGAEEVLVVLDVPVHQVVGDQVRLPMSKKPPMSPMSSQHREMARAHVRDDDGEVARVALRRCPALQRCVWGGLTGLGAQHPEQLLAEPLPAEAEGCHRVGLPLQGHEGAQRAVRVQRHHLADRGAGSYHLIPQHTTISGMRPSIPPPPPNTGLDADL